MRMLALLVAIVGWTGTAEARETRCGWLQNPTPGNWWLADGEGQWVLANQGSPLQADGMDLMPDISQRDYVRTNGGYGYGCACLSGEFDRSPGRVRQIVSIRQLPLSRCRADRALPRP